MRKSVLKEIAAIILTRNPQINFVEGLDQWYLMITDMIDTWLYKPPKVTERAKPKFIFKILYQNKGMTHLQPGKILRETDFFCWKTTIIH